MSEHEDSPFDAYRADVDRPLGRLFREYGVPRWPWLLAGIVSNFVSRAALLLPPVVLGTSIDAVFSPDGAGRYSLPLVPAAWIPTTQVEQFWFSLWLIFGAFVAGTAARWAWGVTMNRFAHGVMHAIRTDTYAAMQDLDMAFFDDKQTGEVMSILNNDASNLEVFLDDALSEGLRLVVMVLGIAGILFYYNAQLAAITLVFVPLMGAFTLWFMRKAEPRYKRVRQAIGDLNTRLENGLAGIQLVKTSGTETYETGRVRGASREVYDANMSILKLSYFYRPGMGFLAGLSFATTFLVGGLWLFQGAPGPLSGDLSVGEFVVFVFMTQRFVEPLSQVSSIVDWYENAKASGERVFGLMDVPPHVTERDDAISLEAVEGRVTYDDVTFTYDGETEPVLRGIDVEAVPGETVALVGSTGAGKSTTLKLLMRLYDVDGSFTPVSQPESQGDSGDVDEGAVEIDGHDVRDVTLDSIRANVGYVGQNSFLFDGTVAENVRYGRFDATHEEVVEAAKLAEAHAFIEDLPEGYETRVGERGVKLSGGQRQRLAIARVVLQDPPILVLDEATSDVDTETELRIQRSLDRLAADRTTFAIAHRLSTIKGADRILVLEDGRIVERGTHEELVAADGRYATLWGVQAGEVDALGGEFGD